MKVLRRNSSLGRFTDLVPYLISRRVQMQRGHCTVKMWEAGKKVANDSSSPEYDSLGERAQGTREQWVPACAPTVKLINVINYLVIIMGKSIMVMSGRLVLSLLYVLSMSMIDYLDLVRTCF